MVDTLEAIYLSFYETLRARIAHLLPRLADRCPQCSMHARRAHAQLDAVLCHLVDCLQHGTGAATAAIAACLSASDLVEIERAARPGSGDEPNALAFRLHHVGLISEHPRPGERYAASIGMYTSDAPHRIPLQWHRFEPDSMLHPLLRSMSHVAFQASDLDAALDGATVILGPYEPIDGFEVAVIDDAGVPTEFIATDLNRAELWRRARCGAGALYRP